MIHVMKYLFTKTTISHILMTKSTTIQATVGDYDEGHYGDDEDGGHDEDDNDD